MEPLREPGFRRSIRAGLFGICSLRFEGRTLSKDAVKVAEPQMSRQHISNSLFAATPSQPAACSHGVLAWARVPRVPAQDYSLAALFADSRGKRKYHCEMNGGADAAPVADTDAEDNPLKSFQSDNRRWTRPA